MADLGVVGDAGQEPSEDGPPVAAPCAGHATAVLDLELANRAYFAASISDRGDEFYEQFAQRHHALLIEQQAGVGAYHVLVAEDGSVLGRFNLFFVEGGIANLGYPSGSVRPDEVWPQ